MFYHDNQLQYTVRCEKPNPVFGKMLQQAIGGPDGEIRVALQYLFQAWATDDPHYRMMLLDTGTEELAHIEMLATAVTLNLRGGSGPIEQPIGESDTSMTAMLGGMSPRHFLSAGMNAMATDSEGNPFDGSHVYASGNLAADMHSNLAAETTGRLLACRLYEITDDPGMKDMLSFLIARDTMHQNQWLAVLEEMGQHEPVHPIPNSFNRDLEKQDVSYTFFSTAINGEAPYDARWTSGRSIDGLGVFNQQPARPMGQVPRPDPQPVQAFQDQNIIDRVGVRDNSEDKSILDRFTESLSDEEQPHS